MAGHPSDEDEEKVFAEVEGRLNEVLLVDESGRAVGLLDVQDLLEIRI